MPKKEKRVPLIAATLSFLVWGTGQIYNGEIKKGIALFLTCITLMSIYMVGLLLPAAEEVTEVGFIDILIAGHFLLMLFASIFIWIWNIIDAWNGAKK